MFPFMQRTTPEIGPDQLEERLREGTVRLLDATDYLLRIGFDDVVSVHGVPFGWARTGRPIER